MHIDMKFKHLFLVLIFVFANTISIKSQLLWEISGKNSKRKSYLFGTHHLIPVSFLDSVPELFKSFNKCDLVIGEIALNNIDFSSKFEKAAMLPDGMRISQLMSEKDYNYVDSILKESLKMGLDQMALLHPSLITNLYELELYSKYLGITDDIQSDSYFQLMANYKGIEVLGLETDDEQIALLINKDDLEKDAEILVKTVRNTDKIINEFLYLNKLYRSGKIEDMVFYAKSPNQTIEMTEHKYAQLVDNRNIAWMQKLPALLNGKSCFIAVGALHLGGKYGLIQLLKDAGYKVNAVK